MARKKKECQDEYYLFSEEITAKSIVRIYRPILTPEEYERRLERVKAATAKLIYAIEMEKLREKENEDV